jgi:hypothetical protein
MNNKNEKTAQRDKRVSFSLKQKAEEFIENLRGNPSIVLRLLITSPNAVFLIVRSYTYYHCRLRQSWFSLFLGVPPYDYNSLVVKSLGRNHCHAGQVCGLGSDIYNHRLRYALSKLLDIPPKHITGFTLGNTIKSIEPYWPSISINGQSIKFNEDYHRDMEEHVMNPSISNNASQDKYQTVILNTAKNNETAKTQKYFIWFFSFYEWFKLFYTVIQQK